MKKYNKPLDSKLSDAELSAAGFDLATVNEDIEKLEEEKKESAASFKNKIDLKRELQHALQDKILNGSEKRDVPVFERIKEDDPNVVEVVREDNGQVVEARPLTEADAQIDMGLEDGLQNAELQPADEGRAAFIAGEPADSNPYFADKEPAKREEWAKGYDAADLESKEDEFATEGRDAFAANKLAKDNPYIEGDQEKRALWDKGFKAAEMAFFSEKDQDKE